MRATRSTSLGLALWLLGQGALAQVPGPVHPVFKGWAPLGAYERAAFREDGALRITIPTRRRNVEIAFTPQSVLSPDYGAEQLDARGARRGIAAPHVTAYTGRVERNSGRDFAKLSYQAQLGKLLGLVRVDGAFYELTADLATGAYLLDVREIDASEVGALMRSCAAHADELALPATAPSTTSSTTQPTSAAATSLKEIELGTEADAPFVAQTGGVAAANSRILAIVNMVNGIYETDLGLTNRVVAQRAYSSSDPYTTTNPDTLLDQFTSAYPRNVATRHDDALLFSGRDLDSNTVGVAWLESTCTTHRYGLAQYFAHSDSLTSLIAAHELGHNLGAHHSGAGIMAPTIDPAYDYFVQASKDEIAFYLAKVSCLSPTMASGSNSPPVLDPVGPQAVSEGQTLSLQLAATDADGDTLDYDAAPLPPGATLSQSGLFEWTPPRDFAGCSASRSLNVRFTASDGQASASELVPISVDDVPTNATPVLLDPADRSVFSGLPLQFQLQASDADGDALAFSGANLPAGAGLSAAGAFSWTPAATQLGSFAIDFTVTDCSGRSAAQSVQIDVTPRPAPHLIALSQVTGWKRGSLTITGSELSGRVVRVLFAGKKAKITSLSNTSVSVIIPGAGKRLRDGGALPVTLVRDQIVSDNALAFDYVSP